MEGYYVIYEINTNSWMDKEGNLMPENNTVYTVPTEYKFNTNSHGSIEIEPQNFVDVQGSVHGMDFISETMNDHIMKFQSMKECENYLLNEVESGYNKIYSIRKKYICNK